MAASLARLGAVLCFVACAACAPARSFEIRTANGVITGKTFKPASLYRQYPSRSRPGSGEPSEIPIAEAFVFEIAVEGLSETVRYPLNTIAARKFSIGQKVEIDYVKRAIMSLRKRIFVREMRSTLE